MRMVRARVSTPTFSSLKELDPKIQQASSSQRNADLLRLFDWECVRLPDQTRPDRLHLLCLVSF